MSLNLEMKYYITMFQEGDSTFVVEDNEVFIALLGSCGESGCTGGDL